MDVRTFQENTVTPFLSVIIPVFGNAELLEVCLSGIRQSSYCDFEIIVADDASPSSAPIEDAAKRHGARLVRLHQNRGPATARNRAAEAAAGEVLVFLDSDVTVHADTLARIADTFQRDPQLAALMGSYDLDPDVHGTVATFRNLLHAHVHHRSSRQATTFWAGCGGVRRARFLETGGFDESYPQPSIEDVEFGMRLHRDGGKLALDPAIQVTHRKRWTVGSMLYADTFLRAMPWTGLMLNRGLPRDLNFRWQDRLSLLLAAVFPALAFLAVRFGHEWWGVAGTALAAVGLLQWPLFRFLVRTRSLRFSFACFPLYLLHCWSAAVGFVLGFFRWETIRDRSFPAAAAILAVLIFGGVQWAGGAYRAGSSGFAGQSAHFLPRIAFGHGPPLFHIVESVWWLFAPPSRASGILLEGLLGWFAALSFYRIARSIAPALVALPAACLMVATPVFQSSVSHQMTGLLALCFGLLAMQALIRFLRRRDQRAFAEAGVWCALCLLTSGTAAMMIPVPLLALVPGGHWRQVRIRYWIWFFVWVGTALLWYLLPFASPMQWAAISAGPSSRIDLLLALAGPGVAALAALGALTLLRRYEPVTAVSAAMVISMAACCSVLRAIREPRHFVLVLPALLLLGVSLLRFVWSNLPRPAGRVAAGACAVAALVFFPWTRYVQPPAVSVDPIAVSPREHRPASLTESISPREPR